jgi:hypothetical protein
MSKIRIAVLIYLLHKSIKLSYSVINYVLNNNVADNDKTVIRL